MALFVGLGQRIHEAERHPGWSKFIVFLAPALHRKNHFLQGQIVHFPVSKLERALCFFARKGHEQSLGRRTLSLGTWAAYAMNNIVWFTVWEEKFNRSVAADANVFV